MAKVNTTIPTKQALNITINGVRIANVVASKILVQKDFIVFIVYVFHLNC